MYFFYINKNRLKFYECKVRFRFDLNGPSEKMIGCMSLRGHHFFPRAVEI